MKKRLLFTLALVLALALALSIVAFAEENVPTVTDELYLVQSLDSEAGVALTNQGKTNIITIDDLLCSTAETFTATTYFDSYADGSHIEITLAENIVIKSQGDVGILINNPVTVTVIFNEYTFAVYGGVRDNRRDMFVMNDANATLRLIGSYGKLADESNNIVVPTITNGEITSNNHNLDVYHNAKVCVWVYNGNVFIDNMRAFCGEEVVYCMDNEGDASVDNTFEFKNCVFDSNTEAIGLLGRASSKKIILADNCYIETLHCETVLSGSKVTNCVLGAGGINLDCYGIAGQLFEFENCVIPKTTTATGRTHLQFTDCTFEISTVSLGSDGGGKSYLYVITTPDCENAGTKTTYLNGNMSGQVDAEYSLNNPKLGHTKAGEPTALSYTNGFDANGFYSFDCSVCEKNYTESEGTAKPIFTAKGYSFKEDTTNGHGIAGGYTVNHTARAEYEKISGTKLEFGIIMFNVNSDQAKALNEKLFNNGKLTITEKALQIDATSTSYSIINFSIDGFKEASLGLELAISLYVTEIIGEGEGATYETSFVQSSEKTSGVYTNGGTSLTTVTYYSVSGTSPEEQ